MAGEQKVRSTNLFDRDILHIRLVGVSLGEAAAYSAVCLAMWPVPLLNRLHVESAAVLAVAAFFIAGVASLARFHRREGAVSVLAGRLAVLVLPLALMMVPMFWAPNCGWRLGVGFFLLFPAVTVIFAVAAAMLVTRLRFRHPRLMLAGTGLMILLVGPLFDLGLHPQFYTYNHVFGGVLGPIYDEQLAIRPGLFAFRVMTLLWAALAASFAQGRFRWALAVAVLLGLSYANRGSLGINTGYEDLSAVLQGRLETEHFEIIYDSQRTDSLRIRQIRDTFEFEYARIAGILDVQVTGKVLAFVYPDAETRAQLTGARYTSVSPVWLALPQLHVLDEGLQTVFPHELAHVFSREFGLPVLRASISVGLVEGLAGALEPASSLPSGDDLISAAATATGLDPGKRLPEVLSPWGFWTGRGGVSYTVAGSFVKYLLDAYGPGPLKTSYSWASLEASYGQPVERLVEGWRAALDARPYVDVDAVFRARIRLGAPSLFERACPHFVRPEIRLMRTAESFWDQADTTGALALIGRAMALAPRNPTILRAWSRMQLRAGGRLMVRDTLRARPDSVLHASLLVMKADFAQAEGDSISARAMYESVLANIPRYARTSRLLLALRVESWADPSVGRFLTGVGEFDQIGSESGRALAALLDPESELPEPGPLPEWAARVWLPQQNLRRAQILYRGGHPLLAEEAAARSADQFLEIGDPVMSAFVRHSASRYGFAASLQTSPSR